MADIGIGAGSLSPDQVLNQISSAIDAGDLNKAGQLANRAVIQGVRHPVVFNARGLALQASGYHQEAVKDFTASLSYLPGNPTVLNAIGVSLLSLERLHEAIHHFDLALAARPDHAPAIYRRGLANALLGNHDIAEREYKHALKLDPDYAEALASLASVFARKRKSEDARKLAERALALKPGEPTAGYALAMVELGEQDYVAAEARLRQLLAEGRLHPQARSGALGLLGDALDGQGRYSEAFETYVRENEDLRKGSAQNFAEARAADAVQHLISYFETANPQRWRDTAPDTSDERPEQHVFLLGFMRSGTTLLEQVLASNPNVVATEEKGTLNGPSGHFMTSNEGLENLAELSGKALNDARQAYWHQVRDLGLDVRGKVYVDKQPLNTIKLPLIAKLFPDAKVLFALRDPRDVVFSCFRRHFRVNITMFEFLALDDAARFYASAMQLSELYRKTLPLNLFEHRYEDMVMDFEGRVRAVCDFMGLQWADSMRDFSRIAPAVDLRSPSAHQVRRPLYNDGVGQWQNYAEQLAPIMPILQPWVDKFGYATPQSAG